jgi:DNA-binding transcriptional ArsR family regulator
MNEPAPIEIHKALADDTRYRLYRYLRLSGRPVPVRELATRLGLHANTIRPHLRRLVDAGRVGDATRPVRRRPTPDRLLLPRQGRARRA